MTTVEQKRVRPFGIGKSVAIYPLVNVRKTGRNESCPCGSGKKFKKCCLNDSPATK